MTTLEAIEQRNLESAVRKAAQIASHANALGIVPTFEATMTRKEVRVTMRLPAQPAWHYADRLPDQSRPMLYLMAAMYIFEFQLRMDVEDMADAMQ